MRNARDPYEGMFMTRRDLDHVYGSVRDAHTHLSSGADRDFLSKLSKPTMQGAIEKGRRSVGIGVGALGAGYLQGRTNTVRVFGTPVPTGVALALGAWAIGAFGENYLGSLAGDFHNLGDGAFASWATILGLGWGQQARLDSGQAAAPLIAGALPSYSRPQQDLPRPLSEAEVLGMRFAKAA